MCFVALGLFLAVGRKEWEQGRKEARRKRRKKKVREGEKERR